MAFDPTKDYITREEQFLTVMAGNSDINFPEPITRFEHYLAAMCDSDNYPAPAPITRLEHYLSAIAQKISEGGGGGGGGYGELIATDEVTVNTSSTSAISVKDISLSDDIDSYEYGLNIVIKDKAGLREQYFYCSDCSCFQSSYSRRILRGDVLFGKLYITQLNGQYGVYVSSVTKDSANKYTSISLSAKYNQANSGTIDGTFTVEIYKQKYSEV